MPSNRLLALSNETMENAGHNRLDPPVVARFAPSPTGISHAGNIFTYLLTWLIAKSEGGKVVCRIEDLDSSRSKKGFADAFLRMIDETGLDFDDGPFYQSSRKEAYASLYKILEGKGLTYPCFCTRRDLAIQSAPHESDRPKTYDRCCLRLSSEEVSAKMRELENEGRKPSSRLLTDSRGIQFEDMVYGDQNFVLDRDCGDFVIKRADDDFAYHLAVVADDIDQGVNLVSRGNDLLPCTPQQMYLYQLLGEDPPRYAHFPLFCAEDGKRLAKRDESATYDALKSSLGSPEHVIGHIAHIAGLQDEDGPATPSELLKGFDSKSLKDKYGSVLSIPFK